VAPSSYAPPGHLTEDQKEAWRYAIDHAPPGLLRSLDLALLEVWVVHLDLHRKAAAELFASKSKLVNERDGAAPMPNRHIAVMRNAAMVLSRLACELGFSPSSRSRVVTPGGERSVVSADQLDKPATSLEQFLANAPAVQLFRDRRTSRRQ
jgi:P27 family predicted phage terminase small subunit